MAQRLTKREREAQRAAAIKYLREQVGEYATRDDRGRPILYFIVKRVSASGMSRVFSTFYVTRDGGSVIGIDHLIARAGVCGAVATDDGYRVSGCGMDMRFAVANDLAYMTGMANDGNDIAYRSV
jgi:hypothetical protein